MDFIIDKNWNGKLGCDVWCHVTRQPKDAIHLPMKMVVRVKSAPDYDAGVECELYDLGRSTLSDCPEHLIWLSHGMDRDDYYKMVTDGVVDPSLPNEMEVGVYFFRIKN